MKQLDNKIQNNKTTSCK